MKQIRSSKFSKFLAYYLALMMFLQVTQPTQLYALTSGPTQPEFSAFTPIGTSDMVDLASGDFNYNIPIMDVGGYPLNLAYNSGVTMDQEASWVGLGWNLNVGQINRQMRGLPDDFNGDPMVYENNMKDNVTVGASFGLNIALLGTNESGESTGGKDPIGNFNPNLGITYNNYNGIGFNLSAGLSYDMGQGLNVGMQMESSASEGVSVSPSITFDKKIKKSFLKDCQLGLSVGVSYNSRKGIEAMTFSPSIKREVNTKFLKKVGLSPTLSLNPDVTFTPTKRVGMKSSNFMFNMNIEGEILGIEPGIKFSGFRSSQGIDDSEKYKVEQGFGYENSYNASDKDILDFNREKDRTLTRNTTVLPITNYTYDLYSIQGQGVSGMFRPYKGQVGYLFDNYIKDKSNGGSLGIEIGTGNTNHWGFNATYTHAKSHTKLWSSLNPALSRFTQQYNNKPDYEKTYFKNIGGTHVDTDLETLNQQWGANRAIKLDIEGSKHNRSTSLKYYKEDTNWNYSAIASTDKMVRKERVHRNQAIQKLTRKEAARYGYSKTFSDYAKDHHTAEIRILKEAGEQYVFGKALYNHIKREVSFDMSNKNGHNGNCGSGLITYLNGDNSVNNKRDGDRYFNRVTTPDYAHTYLLTHVLSSDYQDTDAILGPSDGDLGSYTKFTYENISKKDGLYKWRVPYGRYQANYDEGLKSSEKDDKANYLYGEKELSYIKQIETKTHIAIFEISERKDAFGVLDENGGFSKDSKSYKLNKIHLYSKPEYLAYGDQAKPIKTAHFIYDYSLCKNIENNSKDTQIDGHELSNEFGKLTLKKVYFTYRDSQMGKYTPYEFNYINNYDYNMKAYDIWGNYKPVATNVSCHPTGGSMSNQEYPYVDQTDRAQADLYASAWHLGSIELPSGGTIEVEYESDDYAYVQNKQALQMFKVVGSGDGSETYGNQLFEQNISAPYHHSYLYVQLNENINDIESFKEKYIRALIDQPIYFRFLLNMHDPHLFPIGSSSEAAKYDYVTGYLELDNDFKVFNNNIVAIKIKTVDKGDGVNQNKQVNPISKAGWFFGRSYLNKMVYGITNEEDTDDLKSIVMELIGTIPSVFQILQSPNGRLEQKEIASQFIPEKSWIRLMQPDNKKIGGGSRVKQVVLKDQWDVMTSNNEDPFYKQFYGQQYSYALEEGENTTSGVATYEPIGCKENPLVQPFYDKSKKSSLLGPDDQNYVETPLGESFYPSPKITYSRVTVKNLPRERAQDDKNYVVKKHATGKVVTEFFTSYDYPTFVEYTPLSSKYDQSPLSAILNLKKTHITLSQGFMVHTNDMDGKTKSQRVYGEGQDTFISGVDYKYYNHTDPQQVKGKGYLDNEVTTINKDREVKQNIVGVDYDVINDFRENKSVTQTYGVRFNTAGFTIPPVFIVVVTPLPSYSRVENQLKTSVTTKVIHSSGILRETIAYDLGAVVSTKNLAWDAQTGQVLLTQTVNEYNDHYYSFNYPAYWNQDYKAMGQSATNLDLVANVQMTSNGVYRFGATDNAKNYLLAADELWVIQNKENGYEPSANGEIPRPFKAWVVEVKDNGDIHMIDSNGLRVDQYRLKNGQIKVVRSGYRNLQAGSMASITSMTNPLQGLQTINNKTYLKEGLFEEESWDVYKIINASAIEYEQKWPGQCECNLPEMRFDAQGSLVFDFELLDYNSNQVDAKIEKAYNPYRYNILGNWRAKRSFAYLTGRHHTEHVTPRITGFYNDFYPFYTYNVALKKWEKSTINADKWTFASEVTHYNPYGQEVENKDALNRYSSALYGYNYRFPLAVASNTRYSELGYDGFEDYDFSTCDSLSHFSFEASLDHKNISISSTRAHTGRKSIRVAPSTLSGQPRKASLTKKIMDCPEQTPLKTEKSIQTK